MTPAEQPPVPRPVTIPPRALLDPIAHRILVVDDEPSARSSLERLLAREGFVTAGASDGEAALVEAARCAPDLVITDLGMTPMGGLELCRRLHDADPTLPVIVMTAMADVESVVESLRVGAEDYFTKPFTWEAVLFRVKRALERRSMQREKELLNRTLNERLVLSSLREQELAESEARQRAQLNALLEKVHEGVVIGTSDGHMALVNGAARRILGLDEAAPATIAELDDAVVPEPRGDGVPHGKRPLARALDGEPFDDDETVYLCADGMRRRLNASGTSVRDERGEVVRAMVVFRDVTEQRLLEQHREEYLALVSHDIRNPLNSIGMSLFLLKELAHETPRDYEHVVQLIDRASRNVSRITTMLDELTEATTLELTGAALRPRPVDLRAIVGAAIDGIDDARRRRVSLRAALGASFVVMGDTARLERVVSNLLSNALKYSGPEQPVTARLTRSGNVVRLDVVDQGIGIAPEQLPMLFQRYARTSEGRAAASGLGLGLYIVRLIVEAHAGHIEVVSARAAGSTFSVLLPALAP